jgi:hypothetical protein
MRRTLFLIAYLVSVPFLISCASTSGTPPQAITVSVTPQTASVIVGQMNQFSATVTGTNNTNVNWLVVGGAANGTISSGGLYTAPATVPTPANINITATSQADTSKPGSATVTVTANTSNITVVVSPNPVNVPNFDSQQFSAAVSGTSNTAVHWEVDGTAGGSQQFGYISSAGRYFAPGAVPIKATSSGGSTTTTLTVTAVSQANASASGSATVTLVPANQSAQPLPINLGTSGGNANDSSTSGNTITCCGGTLGSLVVRGGAQYILSNTHVLARSDLSPATGGDPIIQPGLIDANCNKGQATNVANLSQYYNLETGSGPKIDAAIAQVVPGAVSPTGDILYLGSSTDANGVPLPGAPNGGPGVAATVNMAVAKSSRSTGLTCSTVFSTFTSTSVQYQKGCGTGTKFTVNYTGQVDVEGGSFSAEGDSGSLIVTQSNADPVALLYAGSDTDTVGNPVSDVLNFFKSGSNSATFAGAPRINQPVIGCRLPLKPASATLTVPAATGSAEGLQRAMAVRDAHVAELLAHPEVQAVGVGASYDNPAEPVILFFVTKGQLRTNIPSQIDDVRTRIIEEDVFSKRGALSASDSATLEQSAPPPQLIYSVPDAEVARAKFVHAAHADEWMNKAGVQGVGIGSSVDSPGEAALIIFLIRGDSHDPIPPVIDGLRTRVRESSRFRAGFGDTAAQHACTAPAAGKLQPKPASDLLLRP